MWIIYWTVYYYKIIFVKYIVEYFFSIQIFHNSFFPPFRVERNRSNSPTKAVEKPCVELFACSYQNRRSSCWKAKGSLWYLSKVISFQNSAKNSSKLLFSSWAFLLSRESAIPASGLIFSILGTIWWRMRFRGIDVSSLVSSCPKGILFFLA